MLLIDVRALARHAATVSDELPPTDSVWTDLEDAPTQPVSVVGRVSAAGGGRYYWSGTMRGVSEQLCRRCLEPVSVPISERIRAIFAEPGVEGNEDPDVYLIDPGTFQIDLKPAVREHWILNVPHFALCREDCRGLCPHCGENLNLTNCSCPEEVDPRWEDLSKARGE
jgi:uncharacterized protein